MVISVSVCFLSTFFILPRCRIFWSIYSCLISFINHMLLCFCFILLTIQQVVLKLQKSVFYIIHQSGKQSIAALWSLTHMLSAIHHLISCSFESLKSPIIINQTNKQTEIMKDGTPQFCIANILYLLFFLTSPSNWK